MASEAAELVFDGATKQYAGLPAPAVDHLSLTVPAGEMCVLIGPSGGGKTTALKLVNRLIELSAGDIRIDGTSIKDQNLVQLRRGIGYVIQQVGLFPHMNVEANIGTVPRLFGRSRSGSTRARRSCSSSSASTSRTGSATRRSSPAANGSASGSPGPSPRIRR